MPRPAGVRNHDFAEKRADLIRRLTDYALNSDLQRPALRQFAQALSTSEPTLRHYFGDRSGVITAVLEEIGRRGQGVWSVISTPSSDLKTAIEEYFRVSEAGMRHGGFVRAHAFGLIEGLADPVAGRAYLKFVLDPALKAISDKLTGTPGSIKSENQHSAAALALFAPLLMMALHQDLLEGKSSHPLDRDGIIEMLQDFMKQGLSGD